MIAYEIQLGYVIRDKIQSEIKFTPNQSEAKFSPRQNSVRKKISLKKKFSQKICCQKINSQIFSQTEFSLRCCLGFPVDKVSCLGQIDAYHH